MPYYGSVLGVWAFRGHRTPLVPLALIPAPTLKGRVRGFLTMKTQRSISKDLSQLFECLLKCSEGLGSIDRDPIHQEVRCPLDP